MVRTYLDFEKPVAQLDSKIEALIASDGETGMFVPPYDKVRRWKSGDATLSPSRRRVVALGEAPKCGMRDTSPFGHTW